eukprot:PhM_4_TR8312/c3_g1_i7/m.77726
MKINRVTGEKISHITSHHLANAEANRDATLRALGAEVEAATKIKNEILDDLNYTCSHPEVVKDFLYKIFINKYSASRAAVHELNNKHNELMGNIAQQQSDEHGFRRNMRCRRFGPMSCSLRRRPR